MNLAAVPVLVTKDLTLYFRNRFFGFITVLALLFYIGIYFFLPATVDETLELAVYGTALPPALATQFEEEGIAVRPVSSEAALRELVAGGDIPVGITFPDGFGETSPDGDAEVHLYLRSDLPDEFQDAYRLLVEEVTYQLSGMPLNVRVSAETLGPDLAGQQIPVREQMLPLFAVFLMLMETLGLASLITTEVEANTIQALLITPLQTASLFLSKAITGVGLAFGQALLLMAVTGGLARQPLLIITALFLGGLLATGIAFLIASVASDMMSVLAWGMLAILLLAIPAFTILIPGIVSAWIRLIPSFYLVDTVYRVANLEAGWAEMSGNLLVLLAFALFFLGLGALALRRKFQ